MASGSPYLGSKISLISKAEIRYDGILHAVDTKGATVTLSKVRSFGTEDRPVAKRIPPRNDVYEYIIFRGSDIRDLSVNRDITSQDEHQDPAIVSASTMQPPLLHPHPPQPLSSSLLGVPIPPSPVIPPPGSIGQGFAPFAAAGSFNNPFGHYMRPPVMIAPGPFPPQHISPPQMTKSKDIASRHTSGHANTSTPISGHVNVSTSISSVSNVSHIHTSPISLPELGLNTQTSSHSPVTQTTSVSVPVPLLQLPASLIDGAQSQGYRTATTSLVMTPRTLLQPGSQNTKVATGSQSMVDQQQGQPSSVSLVGSSAVTLVSVAPTQTQPLSKSKEAKPSVVMSTTSHDLSGVQKPPSPIQHSSVSPGNKTRQQRQPSSGRRGSRGGRERDKYHPRDHWPQDDGGYFAREGRYEFREGRYSREYGYYPQDNYYYQRQRGGYSVRAGGGEPRSSKGRGTSRGRTSHGGTNSAETSSSKPIFRYDSDFDFETANARFSREEVLEELKKMKVEDEERSVLEPDVNGEPQSPDAIVVEEEEGDEHLDEAGNDATPYVKDQFFDSISCESKPRALNKRPNRSNERALNTETFGTYSRGYRGQGRYPYNRRGGYGRNWRGGGGYQNYRYDYSDQRRGGYGGYQKQTWSREGRSGGSERVNGKKSQSREKQQPKEATTEATPETTPEQ